MQINLQCWHCGKVVSVEVEALPMYAFQIAALADDIGWVGVIDMARGRSLVFCCQDHANAEKTKAGHFRARAKGPNNPLPR